MSVDPAWKWRHETKTIRITGQQFFGQPHSNYNNKDNAHTLGSFTVMLGAHTLQDVTWAGNDRLEAVVPNTLPVGTYDLVVIDPAGQRGTLPGAFVVRSSDEDGGPNPQPDSGRDLAVDGGVPDARRPDSGRDLAVDGGVPDLPQPDVGVDLTLDSGVPDLPQPDVGVDLTLDSGVPDLPQPDVGVDLTLDSGVPDLAQPDVGVDLTLDSGVPDLPQPDVGVDLTLDSGVPDAPPPDSGTCAYLYRRPITIDYTKVGLTNSGALPATGFPVLVSLSGSWLMTKSVAPVSGRITSAQGHDIVFRKSDGTTALGHQIETYDGTTGTLVAWVRIDSLSKAANTIFYIYYGNACITAPTQNPAAVWDASYKGVWHLDEEAAGTGNTGVYKDSTQNANHGDDQVSATGQGGQVAAGQEFDGVDDTVECGNHSSLNIRNQNTISAWVNMASRPAKDRWYNIVTKSNYSYALFLYGESASKTVLAAYYLLNTGKVDTWKGPSIDIPTNAWTHVAITFDGTQSKTYVNGVLDYTFSKSGTIRDNSTEDLRIVEDESRWFGGFVDEARVSATARDGDWIVTSYNNQKNPGNYGSPGFYSVGSEQSAP
jgi:hypothetical protein